VLFVAISVLLRDNPLETRSSDIDTTGP
jgi:hypothetical protein